MKKRFKGFTLIECLVALAVLGIASLTMAQIYANVAQRNRNNHILNTSIANQMSYVERYTNSQAVPVYYGNSSDVADGEAAQTSTTKYPPHKKTLTTNYNYVQLIRVKATADPLSDSFAATDRIANSTYSFPVDVYVLMSRDRNDVSSNNKKPDGTAGTFDQQYKSYFTNSSGKDKDLNLRYKYITGHTT